MKFPELNTRCEVQQKTITQESVYGSDIETWSLLGTRWCNIQDTLPSRSESQSEGLVTGSRPMRVRFAYCTDINSSMRIIINRPTRTIYQLISGPAILGDKDQVEFMAERLTGENN